MNVALLVLLLSLLATAGGLYYFNTQPAVHSNPLQTVYADTNTLNLNTQQDANVSQSNCVNFLTRTNKEPFVTIGEYKCKVENYAKEMFQRLGVDPFPILLWTCIILFLFYMLSQFLASGTARAGGFLLLILAFIFMLLMLKVL